MLLVVQNWVLELSKSLKLFFIVKLYVTDMHAVSIAVLQQY